MRPLLINGIRFEGIREAVRITGIPRTSLKRLLRDPEKPEFVILVGEEHSYGKTPIFGQKEGTPSLLFYGIVDAVAAGFATNKQNATRLNLNVEILDGVMLILTKKESLVVHLID
jgi:hypothetical protein